MKRVNERLAVASLSSDTNAAGRNLLVARAGAHDDNATLKVNIYWPKFLGTPEEQAERAKK